MFFPKDAADIYNQLQEARATIERLSALLRECRDWYGFDGDGINEPLIGKIIDAVGARDCE